MSSRVHIVHASSDVLSRDLSGLMSDPGCVFVFHMGLWPCLTKLRSRPPPAAPPEGERPSPPRSRHAGPTRRPLLPFGPPLVRTGSSALGRRAPEDLRRDSSPALSWRRGAADPGERFPLALRAPADLAPGRRRFQGAEGVGASLESTAPEPQPQPQPQPLPAARAEARTAGSPAMPYRSLGPCAWSASHAAVQTRAEFQLMATSFVEYDSMSSR